MLPSLLRKAIGDAGFDLKLGSTAEWEGFGVSGLPSAVAWVLPMQAGATLALAEQRILQEFTSAGWTDVPLPAGAKGAVRCRTPAELFDVLKRVRLLFAQLPPLPEQRLAERMAAVDTTEALAVVKRRIGQNLFREMLMEYWEGRCAVTGLPVPELLRASHAKPWAVSDDRERLDVHNGFLLAVHLDALFDQGLMTFTADGVAGFSPQLEPDSLAMILPVAGELRLGRLTDGHRKYLEYHRVHVFQAYHT